jgi:hypothetical protein
MMYDQRQHHSVNELKENFMKNWISLTLFIGLCASISVAEAGSFRLVAPQELVYGGPYVQVQPFEPFDIYLDLSDFGDLSQFSFQLWIGATPGEIGLIDYKFFGDPITVGTPLTGISLVYGPECLSTRGSPDASRIARFTFVTLQALQERTIGLTPYFGARPSGSPVIDCEGIEVPVSRDEIPSVLVNPSPSTLWPCSLPNVRHFDMPERIALPGESVDLALQLTWLYPEQVGLPKCVPTEDAWPKDATSVSIELRWDASQARLDGVRKAIPATAVLLESEIDNSAGRAVFRLSATALDATYVAANKNLVFLQMELLDDADATPIVFGEVDVRSADGTQLPIYLSSGSIGMRTVATESLNFGAIKARF